MSSNDQPESQLTRKQLRELRMTGATPIVTAADAAADAKSDETAAAPATPASDAATPLDAAPEPETAEAAFEAAPSASAPVEAEADASAEPLVTVDDVPLAPSTHGGEDADSAAAPSEHAPDDVVDLDAVPRTRRQAREQERIRTASVPVITPDEPIVVPVVETSDPAPSQPWWKPKGSAAKRAAAEEAAAADVPAEVAQPETVTAAEPAVADVPVEDAAVEDVPVDDEPVEDVSDEDAAVEGAPAEDDAVEDAAVEGAAAEDDAVDAAVDDGSEDDAADDGAAVDDDAAVDADEVVDAPVEETHEDVADTEASDDEATDDEAADDEAAGDEPEPATVADDITPAESVDDTTTTESGDDVTDTDTDGDAPATDAEATADAGVGADAFGGRFQKPLLQPKFGQSVAEPEVVGATLPPSFDELIARNGGGGSTSTSNTLIVSQTPSIASLTAPVTATGEVLITGTFALPEGLGSQGHAPGVTDGKDIDVVLLDGELPAASSPTPIAASAAVSQVKAPGDIIRPPAPEKINKTMVVLAITAGVLAVGVIGIIIYAISSGVIG